MRQIIREYFRCLKERNELDAILPELLSANGYTVYSRPAIGTRQHGVDVAAVGTDTDGQRKVFLFSIKAGDLDRNSWDCGPQALRASLNEILDHYIETRIPPEYESLPIAICPCVGGDVHQAVDAILTSYTKRNETSRIEFQLWNGDRLSLLVTENLLGEEATTKEARANLRKSIALLDEPEASYTYFARLLEDISSTDLEGRRELVRFARQTSLCLWILFAWSREVGNVEAAFRTSELATLTVWSHTASFLRDHTRGRTEVQDAFRSLLVLHLHIADHFVSDRVLPSAGKLHALTSRVASPEPVDAIRKLFESLGRTALYGIWVAHSGRHGPTDRRECEQLLHTITAGMADLINNNPVLMTPVLDDQAIDMNLACVYLVSQGQTDFVKTWIAEMTLATIFAYRASSKYPCCLTDYGELLDHPIANDPGYAERATAASTLYPTLAYWLSFVGDTETLGTLAQFVSEELSHCTLQLWLPSQDSEQHLYQHTQSHGVALTDIAITETGEPMLDMIKTECDRNTAFRELSAVRMQLDPLVLTACRHHRVPVPPQFWPTIEGEDSSATS